MKKKIICAFMIGVLSIGNLTACGTDKNDNTPQTVSVDAPTYTLVNQSDYVRDGEECQGYRVVANTDITDDEIIAIYTEITNNDGYKYHTIWLYENEEDLVIPFATLDDENMTDGKPSINR